MAYSKVSLAGDGWTLIGDNVSTITFVNSSQIPVYLNFNTANSAPADDVGLPYPPNFGEVNTSIADIAPSGSHTYVYARPMRNVAVEIIVES